MYKERIIQHYKSPSNYGEPSGDSYCSADAYNSSCGDEITGFVQVEDGVIVDVMFVGEGCAISMASASILSEELIGKNVDEAVEYDRTDVTDALGIDVTPMRLKCALLPRDAFVDSMTEEH